MTGLHLITIYNKLALFPLKIKNDKELAQYIFFIYSFLITCSILSGKYGIDPELSVEILRCSQTSKVKGPQNTTPSEYPRSQMPHPLEKFLYPRMSKVLNMWGGMLFLEKPNPINRHKYSLRSATAFSIETVCFYLCITYVNGLLFFSEKLKFNTKNLIFCHSVEAMRNFVN